MFSLRKTFASLLGVLIIINMSTVSFAIDNKREEIKLIYDESDYTDLTIEEKGKEKMLKSGHSLEFINSLSEKTIEKISTATKALQTTSYYQEEIDENKDTYLKKISKDEFIKLGNRDTEKIADEYIKSTEVVNQYQTQLNKLSIKKHRQNNGGALMVKTTLYSVEWFVEGRYIVVSEYLWTIPPKYRGTDYFGISRDTNTVSISRNLESYFNYKEDVYEYVATSCGITKTKLKPNEYKQIFIPEKNKTNAEYIIETKLPADCLPPKVLMFGSKAVARYYSDIRGGVCYHGALAHPSIIPQYFNHWDYYIHQAKPSHKTTVLSVDKNRSFSVNPIDSFSDFVVDTILYVWD